MSRNRTDRLGLSAIVFAVLFAQVLLYPGIPDLVAALGATPADWGDHVGEVLDAGMWFLTAEFLGFIAFAGLWGAMSDTLGVRRGLIGAGAILGGAGYLLLAGLAVGWSVPYEGVLVIRFFQGAATIGAFTLAITTLMDLGGGHGRNMGAAGLAIGLGTALGAPVGGQLYGIGPLVPLVAAGTILVAVGSVTAVTGDQTPATSRSVTGAMAGLYRQPALSIPYAFGFVDRLTAGFFSLVGTVYFQRTFGLDAAETGLLLGAFFVPFALLQYPLGWLSDRIGRVIPVALGSLVYGIGVISVYYAPSVVMVALAMAGVGVLGALVAPATMALVTDLAATNRHGVAMGGFNAVGSLGFLAGIVAGASIAATYSFQAAFFVVGLAEVLIAIVALPFLLRLDVPGLWGRDSDQ